MCIFIIVRASILLMMSKPFVFRNKMCKYEELYVSFLLSNINKVYYIVDTQKKILL